MKPVAEKMGIGQDARTIFISAPTDAVKAIDPPTRNIASSLRGKFDYIHFFVKRKTSLLEKLAKLKAHVKETGMLWVSWPKAGQDGTDLTLQIVIKLGYDCGLVESKALSINNTWSALKFTHPKPGKIYHNSYGKLKGKR